MPRNYKQEPPPVSDSGINELGFGGVQAAEQAEASLASTAQMNTATTGGNVTMAPQQGDVNSVVAQFQNFNPQSQGMTADDDRPDLPLTDGLPIGAGASPPSQLVHKPHIIDRVAAETGNMHMRKMANRMIQSRR